MNDRDYSVYAENREYLDGLKLEHTIMDDGTAFQLAEAMSKNGKYTEPISAWETFTGALGGKADVTSFAKVCKYLDITGSKEDEAWQVPPKSAVYFRTPVSDRAYSLFSKKYKGLGAMYASDFKTVCEDVYYDRADACILPLESSDDGLIMSFRNMLLKYELTITSIVTIGIGEDKYQTIALLTNGSYDTNGNVCELCLTSVASDFLMSYCESLSHFDATLVRITSVPSKIRGKYDHHICVSVPHENVTRLRFFTDALSPANVFLGQYKNND